MAVVFLEGRLVANIQYKCKWRTPNSIVDSATGYVNPHISNAKSHKSSNAIRCRILTF